MFKDYNSKGLTSRVVYTFQCELGNESNNDECEQLTKIKVRPESY